MSNRLQIELVKQTFQSGEACPDHWRDEIVNCAEIAYITGRESSSAIRNWSRKPGSPLYNMMTKSDATVDNPLGTQRGSLLILLGKIFDQRQAIMDYRRGRKPVAPEDWRKKK